MSITINIKKFSEAEGLDITIPTEWKDIKLDYWAKLATIISKHQKNTELKKTSHRERYSESEDLEKIIQDVEFVDSIGLNRDIFCYLSGLSIDDMKKVDMDQVNKVIETIGMLTEEYKPQGIKSFDCDGETYYFPSESLKNNTYGDFIEATHLDMASENMENGRYDALAEQMAILCRKAGEDFDDDAIPEKTKKFKKLTMDIVYEFAFFLTIQSKKLLKISSMYSEKRETV